MRSSRFHTASAAAVCIDKCGRVREKTVGASLGAGVSEVASELWTERVLSVADCRCFVGGGLPMFCKWRIADDEWQAAHEKTSVDSNGASPLS
jgi:hypothetical protein